MLVAKSTDDYVTLATRLLQDPTLRREMSEAVRDTARTYEFGPNGAAGGLGADVGDILLAALRKKLKTSAI